VKHGDIVYLDQGEDGVLRILSEDLVEEGKKPKEYHLNCELAKEVNLLERLIVGSYLQGIEVTKIFSSTRIDGKQIEEVRNIARRLVGLNIIEESSKEIFLQCFIDPLKFKIVPLMKRLSVITSTMLHEAMEALLKVNPELATDWTIEWWTPDADHSGGVKAINFTLRSGVTFHDGSAWNSTVAAWNLNRSIWINGGFGTGTPKANVGGLFLKAADFASYYTSE